MAWDTRPRSFIARLSYIFFRNPRKSVAETSSGGVIGDVSIRSPTLPVVGDRRSAIDLIVSLYDKSVPASPVTPFTDQGGPLWTSADSRLELTGNVEYRNGRLVGATMSVLLRKMTPANIPADPYLQRVFFLTFRLFLSPRELAEALVLRYCVSPPRGLSHIDEVYWQREIGGPIRRQVFQFIKVWLETYWVPILDDKAISALKALIKKRSMPNLPPWSAYVVRDLLHKRTPSGTTVNTQADTEASKSGFFLNQGEPTTPKVRMTYSMRASLGNQRFKRIGITDFDAVEFARQMTIIESDLFCSIRPEDILGDSSKSSTPSERLQAIDLFHSQMKKWICEKILKPPRFTTRGTVISFFIKVASSCVKLNNFSMPQIVLEAFESQEISKLNWAFQGLPRKQALQLNYLRKLLDRSGNYSEYHIKLRDVAGAAVPWLDPFMLEVTFCRECYPDYRNTVFKLDPKKRMINLSKYYRLAEIYEEIQRFQTPYDLESVPGFLGYMKAQFEVIEARDSFNGRSRRPRSTAISRQNELSS